MINNQANSDYIAIIRSLQDEIIRLKKELLEAKVRENSLISEISRLQEHTYMDIELMNRAIRAILSAKT